MKLNNTYIFWKHTSVLSTVAVGLLVSHLPGCSIRPPGAPWGLAPHPSDVIRSVDNPHHFNDNDWSFFMARPILTYYFSPPRAAFNFYVLIVSPFKCCPGSWSRQRTMKNIEALCNVHKPVMVLSLAFAFAPKTKNVVGWKDPSFIKGSWEVRPWGMRWPLAVHSSSNERQ